MTNQPATASWGTDTVALDATREDKSRSGNRGSLKSLPPTWVPTRAFSVGNFSFLQQKR